MSKKLTKKQHIKAVRDCLQSAPNLAKAILIPGAVIYDLVPTTPNADGEMQYVLINPKPPKRT